MGVRGNASEVQIGRQWARGAIDARLCKARAAKTGSLLSTAFVARDLMRVAEALEDDGLLRYWGECSPFYIQSWTFPSRSGGRE